MHYRFNTPQRTTLNRLNIENQPSSRHYHHQSHQPNRYDSIIDYKAKAYELMQTLTNLQIKDKQSTRTIFYLQRQLEVIHKSLDDFLAQFGVASLSEVSMKYNQLAEQLTKMKKQNEQPLVKDEKITQQYEKILGEYKSMIKMQQDKMLKYQNKWKAQESKLLDKCQILSNKQQLLNHKLEQLAAQNEKQKETIIQKHKAQIQGLESQITHLKQELTLQNKQQEQNAKENEKKIFTENIQMKQDLQMLKSQFRSLLIEKQTIEEKHEKLKKKYKNEIEHFEMIQKQVEEKLIEVEKEITFYKEQREGNIQLIEKLQHQNQLLKQNQKQIQEQFSFGGYFNAETQTQQSGLESQVAMNVQCYEISIKSLLEENTRLKRTLVLLDKSKRGEQISAQAQLELKLLKGLTDTPHSRGKRAERDSEQSPSSPQFKVLEGLQMDPTRQNEQ